MMSDDLIRRSDATEVVYKALRTPPLKGVLTDTMSLAIAMVQDIPSADRPQGEWIRDRYWSRGVGMGEEYGFFYKCSMCEYEVEDGYTRCGFNFCPNCGADMREGADDD